MTLVDDSYWEVKKKDCSINIHKVYIFTNSQSYVNLEQNLIFTWQIVKNKILRQTWLGSIKGYTLWKTICSYFFGPVVSLSEILRKNKNTDDDSVHEYLCNVIYHSKTSNVSKYKSS